jgi:hypothetical protein
VELYIALLKLCTKVLYKALYRAIYRVSTIISSRTIRSDPKITRLGLVNLILDWGLLSIDPSRYYPTNYKVYFYVYIP